MKFNFHVEGDKVFSSNASELHKYIIDEETLKIALSIAEDNGQSIFDVCKNKVLYISTDIFSPDNYKTIKCFMVRTSVGILMWHYKFITIEENDNAYTTQEEADKETKAHSLADIEKMRKDFVLGMKTFIMNLAKYVENGNIEKIPDSIWKGIAQEFNEYPIELKKIDNLIAEIEEK